MAGFLLRLLTLNFMTRLSSWRSIFSSFTFIIAPIAKNGLSSIIGCSSSSSFKKINSVWIQYSPTCTRKFSSSSSGRLTERSANTKVMCDSLKDFSLNFLEMDKGIRLTVAPKLYKHHLKLKSPIEHDNVKGLGYPTFLGILFWRITLHYTYYVRNIFI